MGPHSYYDTNSEVGVTSVIIEGVSKCTHPLFYAFLYVSRREGGYEVTFIGQFAQGVVFLSFTLLRLFSHRAHRVHGAFWRTVSNPQNAFGIQSSQSVTDKGGCKVL